MDLKDDIMDLSDDSPDTYLSNHRIKEVLDAAATAVARERPAAPLKWLADHFLSISAFPCDSQPTPVPPSVVEDLRCTITRKDFFAPGVVMGFGICISGDGRLLKADTDFFPMCAAAFLDLRVRVSAGGLAITHLLPFAIDRPRRSSPVATRLLADTAAAAAGGLGHAESVLLLLGELWKARAVAIGSGEAHVSEQALKAFCALHHLLLAAAAADPAIAAAADARVRRFASGPEWRTKAHEPDLGRFLPLLLLARVPWSGPGSVGGAVLQELFTRQAKCARCARAQAMRARARHAFGPTHAARLGIGDSRSCQEGGGVSTANQAREGPAPL
jgi:hypothetical protein